jgi:hypothetical protein
MGNEQGSELPQILTPANEKSDLYLVLEQYKFPKPKSVKNPSPLCFGVPVHSANDLKNFVPSISTFSDTNSKINYPLEDEESPTIQVSYQMLQTYKFPRSQEHESMFTYQFPPQRAF